MIKTTYYLIAALLLSLVLGGCAGKEKGVERFVLPPPPEEPRLSYITSYRGEVDFNQGTGLDAFIGEAGVLTSKNLVKPYGVGAHNKIIYVTDTALGVVFVFDPVLKKVSFLGDKPSGRLALPVSIAFDSNGTVYVSDAKIKRIYGYDINGTLKSVIGAKDEFMRPTGIAINRDLGILYAVDTLGHNVKSFALDGRLLSTIGKRGSEDGEFNYPTNIDVDRRNGNIIVGDTQNFRIQIFDKNGKFLMKFGKIGDKPGMFARPKGVAVDSEGHIYAADAAFNNIQIFDEKGELLMYFGGTGNTPGTFQLPSGLAFDEQDRLYTTEGYNSRVQVFQYLSEVWKRTHPDEYKQIKR